MYPRITQLGITIYQFPSPHVKMEEVRAIIRQNQLSESVFSNELENNSYLICEGKPGLCPSDVEAALSKMMSKPSTNQILFG